MSRSWGGIVAGLVLVALGGAWLMAEADVLDVSASAVLAVVVIAVGLAVMIVPAGAGRGVLITLGVLLAVLAIAASAVDPGLLDGGIGKRTETPRNTSELEDYELAIGQLVVDLTELDPPARVEARIGIGQLTVIVPASASVSVEADLGAGEIDVRGDRRSGAGVDGTFDSDMGADFELELDGGLGQIRVGGEEARP